MFKCKLVWRSVRCHMIYHRGIAHQISLNRPTFLGPSMSYFAQYRHCSLTGSHLPVTLEQSSMTSQSICSPSTDPQLQRYGPTTVTSFLQPPQLGNMGVQICAGSMRGNLPMSSSLESSNPLEDYNGRTSARHQLNVHPPMCKHRRFGGAYRMQVHHEIDYLRICLI